MLTHRRIVSNTQRSADLPLYVDTLNLTTLTRPQGASEEWMLTHRRIVGDAQRLTVTPPFLQPGSASRTECVERIIRVLSLYALSDPEVGGAGLGLEGSCCCCCCCKQSKAALLSPPDPTLPTTCLLQLGYCQGMSDLAAPLLELWGQHAAQQPPQGLQHLGAEQQQLQHRADCSSWSNTQEPQHLLSSGQQPQQSTQQLQQLQQQLEADTQQVSDQARACVKGREAADKALGRAAMHAGEAGDTLQDAQQQQQHEAAAQQEVGAQQMQQAEPASRHSKLEADFCVLWCFSRLMRLVRQRFMGRMEVLREDLQRLSTLVQHLDSPLHR